MFGIGGFEVAVIIVVLLLVLGPEQLPGAIAQFVKVWREFNRFRHEMQETLTLGLDDLENLDQRRTRPEQRQEQRSSAPSNPAPETKQDAAPENTVTPDTLLPPPTEHDEP